MNKYNLQLEDEVFEFRNKAYGAYAIRAAYAENMTRGFFIALFAIVSFLFVVIKITHQVVNDDIDHIFTINELDVPNVEVAKIKIKRTLMAAPRSAEVVTTNVDKTPVVVKDQQEIKPQEEVKSVATTATGTTTTTGGSDQDGAITGVSGNTSTKGNSIDETPKEKPKPEIRTFASQMPSFPGGESALYEYLNKHMHYPQLAIDNDISGTVVVQFVVNTVGSIENVKVVRGIGFGCDHEAIRVVESMPNWIAGKHMDKTVPVRLTLPIKFALKD